MSLLKTPMQISIFQRKYQGKHETPENKMLHLARRLHAYDARYRGCMPLAEITSALMDCDLDEDGIPVEVRGFGAFVPQGSILAHEDGRFTSLSNCNVVSSPNDSIGSIYRCAEIMAQYLKTRGGVGVDCSRLRPEGAPTRNAALTSSGAPSFIRFLSQTVGLISQNGRRGAALISLHSRHPDVMQFIRMKNGGEFECDAVNMSVMCDEALFQSDEYELRWPLHGEAVVSKRVASSEVLRAIAENAAHHGCPGILFERALKRNCPSHGYRHHEIVTTNPCGEQGLPASDSCRLGVLNLTKFVLNPFLPDACFDFVALKRAAWIGTQLLDDIVDWELDCQREILRKIETDDSIPFEERVVNQRMWLRAIAMAERGRRVGLSATGLGDCIAMLGMKYGDDRSLKFAERVAREIEISAWECSIQMAEKRGAFPDFDPEIDAQNAFVSRIIDQLPDLVQRRYRQFGRRNIACTTWSPAGTISELIGCSSGCEPLPWIRYDRRVKLSSVSPENLHGDYAIETDANGTEWCTFHGTISQSIARWMIQSGCSDPLHESNPYHGQTCTDVPVENKLQMLARLQRWCDSSISNTTNLPRGASADDVLQCIKRAHELGLKGCTVYVDGSRDGVVREAGTGTKTHETIARAVARLSAKSSGIGSAEATLARQLAELLPSGTRVEIACECGCKSMLKTGGCWQCPECGESKCG